MKVVGRDYEYPDKILHENYEGVVEIEGIEKMSEDDFERWRKDLIKSIHENDWVYANILLDEMKASIT